MADQGRWFKLWCVAPADDALQELPPALRWAWAAFGCYTKIHGTHGTVLVSPTNAVLAAEMGITVDDLKSTLYALPHVRVEEGKNRHGAFTVTWQNWTKYQEDSTQAQRAKTSRSKRRREEKRREESQTDPIGSVSGWRPTALRCLEFLNQKTGRTYQPVPANLKLLEARLKDGATEANIRGVIARKVRQWLGDAKMAEFLRPKTLFNATNFAQYLGEREAPPDAVPPVR